MSKKTILENPEMRVILAGKGDVGLIIGHEALQLSGVEKPNVLIIASASNTQAKFDRYVGNSMDVFEKQLGAKTNTMHEFGQTPTIAEIEDKIGSANVVWIPGGRAQHAKQIFDETGIGAELIKASKDTVLSGGSAGTMLLAEHGMSYSTPIGGPNEFIGFDGYPIARLTVSPHNDYVEPEDGNTEPRSEHFKDFIKKNGLYRPTPCIGIDHEAGLSLTGDGFKVIANDGKNNSGVTAFRDSNTGIYEARFTPTSDYVPVAQLAT